MLDLLLRTHGSSALPPVSVYDTATGLMKIFHVPVVRRQIGKPGHWRKPMRDEPSSSRTGPMARVDLRPKLSSDSPKHLGSDHPVERGKGDIVRGKGVIALLGLFAGV